MSVRLHTARHGKGELALSLPLGLKQAMAGEYIGVSPLADVKATIQASVKGQVGSAPPEELIGQRQGVCGVGTDSTRPITGSIWIEPNARAPCLAFTCDQSTYLLVDGCPALELSAQSASSLDREGAPGYRSSPPKAKVSLSNRLVAANRTSSIA